MSKYSLRRILSLLLAVLLVCTLLPTAALAEDGAGTDDPAPKAEEEDTPETTAPAKPSAEEVEALFTDRALLEVQCTNPNHKASAIHSLLPGCYEITDVVETGGDLGYTCHVKISSAAGSAYVKLHDANTGASQPHMSLGGGVDHWLKYDGAAKKWTFVNEMAYTSVIYAVCPPDDSLVREWELRITCETCKDDGKQIFWRDVALSNGEYSVGEVKQDGSGYYCEITVKAEKYVEAFSNEIYIGKYHALAEGEAAEKTFKVRFDGRKWPDNLYTIKDAFTVTCDAIPPEPAAPTDAFIKKDAKVSINCPKGTHSNKEYYVGYDLMDGTYEIGDVVYDANLRVYTCTVTLTQPEKYLEMYDRYTGKPHIWQSASTEIKLFYNYNTANKEWRFKDHTFSFEVSCDTAAPEKPGDALVMELLKNAVSVSCQNDAAAHDAETYDLLEGTYTIGDVTPVGGCYTCTVTVQPERYVTKYNAAFPYAGHTLSPAGQTGSVTLRYDGGSWTWGDAKNRISFEVDCTAYSVTYTDGADGEIFANKVYKDLPYGAETPGFAGTPEREHYVFAGWDPAVADTVSGDVTYTAVWTPVTYTVSYELNGGTAQGNPESYTVESGSFTLKNPARNGYTFTGWSGTGLDGENNMTVTVEKGSAGDRAYTAHWRRSAASSGGSAVRGYTIRASASGGAISPSGSVSVGEGGSRTFTFTPDKGYALCNVLVDGKEIGAAESYTFQNVRSGHTIEAVFMKEDGNPKNGVTASGKPAAETFEASTPEERREKLEAARKANGDAAAWLYIPAAEIDMPVLQTENNAFYLRMGADKEYAPWGSVYADCRAGLESRETLGANTAIFGASAADGDPDGECFSKLFRYLEAEFVEENPYIYLMLADGEELVFRIGACFVTDTEFDYIRPAFETDGAWKTYLETVEKKNLFAFTGAALEKGDTLLTLTTYSEEYDTDKTGEQRFAVVAKLLPDGEDTAAYTVKNAEDPELP